jgi:cytochrome c oxidase cbb3-type subunit 2/cytochrome c oxidase cbb3-type subunit I/II
MTERSARVLRMAYLVASVAGIAFFAMSVALLGIWPGRVLEAQSRAMAPEHVLALTASEQRGREIYSREGCAYCHTQQIRYLHTDMLRFGSPTLAWETRLDYPHLWGTRRIGPDLARQGGTHSPDWHFAHLFSPRAIVPDSVMPGYASLFDGAADRPRQSARDLLAYLETLGRARELAGPEGEAHAREGCDCAGDEMLTMALSGTMPLNASPARPRPRGEAPQVPAVGDLDHGRALFAANCAGCHGATGAGDGRAAATLRPLPADLTEHSYTRARVVDALWNGVAGTSMQAWRDYPPADLAALAEYVRSVDATADREPVAAEQLALGADVYTANCVQCHGAAGDGRGAAVAELRIAPTDFRAQRPSLATAARALAMGVAGTQMAPWTDRLSDEQRMAVARYVRSLFQGDGDGGGGAR